MKSGPQADYYQHLTEFDLALRTHEYPLAITQQRLGLEELAKYRHWARGPIGCPLVEAVGGAIAAVAQDPQILDLMLETDKPGIEVDVALYRKWMAVIPRFREVLGDGRRHLRTDLQMEAAAFGVSRADSTKLLEWLVKFGEIQKQPNGASTFYVIWTSEEIIPPKLSAPASPISEVGLEAAPPWALPQKAFVSRHSDVSLSEEGLTVDVAEVPWRPSDRWETRFRLVLPGDARTWVVDDLSEIGETRILDSAGQTVRDIKLTHRVKRGFSSSGRRFITLVDEEGSLWVYTEEGDLVRSLNMWGLIAATELHAEIPWRSGHTQIRSVAVAPDGSYLVVGIMTTVVFVTIDGVVRARRTLPGTGIGGVVTISAQVGVDSLDGISDSELGGVYADGQGTYTKTSVSGAGGSDDSNLDDQIAQTAPMSWISDDGLRYFAVTDWGHIIETDNDGNPLRYTKIGRHFGNLLVLNGRVAISHHHQSAVTVNAGDLSVARLPVLLGALYRTPGNIVASVKKRDVTFIDLDAGNTTKIELDFDPRVVVQAGQGVWVMGRNRSQLLQVS